MIVAAFNAGSSSLKFGLYEESKPLLSGKIDWGDGSGQAAITLRKDESESRSYASVKNYSEGVVFALEAIGEVSSKEIQVVGQRVVHGGVKLSSSVRIDAEVKAEIKATVELAPLHNPPALEAIEAVEQALPLAAQVAVFDTAYYAHLPASQSIFPVPYAWYSDWGIRRFGFHGINHAYVAARAAELLKAQEPLRIVSCHLGNGCSATASLGNTAVATTMGFTPLDGLMMGTRAGALDPGLLLHLIRQRGFSAESLEELLNRDCGLKGVSGRSGDYREVERAADGGDDRARLALEIYAARVKSAVGALAATLGGADALVFTAGVGEHAPRLRASVCEGLAFMGLSLDPDRNRSARGESEIGTSGFRGRILVIPADEEACLAREALRVCRGKG